MSDAGLRALDERYYEGEELYRTAEWNERGLFAWEQTLIDRHFAGCRRIVVPACGGGREVLALLQAGFDAVGYEPHPGLLAYAREFLAAHGHQSRAHPAPRDEFPPAEGPVDGVVVGWGAFSLLHGRARRISFLEQARRRIAPNGPVLLSFLIGSHDSRELRLTTATANAVRWLRRRSPVQLGDVLAPNLVHVFSPQELSEEIGTAGFEPAVYGTMGRAYEDTSHAAAVVRPA